jgi:hypothetical protein
MGAKMPTNHEDFYRHAREHFLCVYSPESVFLHSLELFVIKFFKKKVMEAKKTRLLAALISREKKVFILQASTHRPSDSGIFSFVCKIFAR